MKKLFTAFVLLMFLMSIFSVAFADEESGSSETSDSETSEDAETSATGSNAEETSKEELRPKLKRELMEARPSVVELKRVRDAIEDKYKACVEKCKGNKGENCDTRCKGLVTSAERLAGIEDKLKDVELQRLKVLKSAEISKLSSLSKEDLKKLAYLNRARLKELAGLEPAKLKEKLANFKLVKIKEINLAKKRIIAESKLKQWNKDFENAKDKFIKEEKLYNEKKQEFLAVKEKLKACEGQDTEECKKLNEDALAKGKVFLTNAANLAIEHLNKIKLKVQSSENIDETEAAEIVAKLDAKISELESAKEKVAAAATKEELQEAAKIINSIWKSVKYNAMAYAARVVHARVGEIVKRSEKLEGKLQCAVDSMENQGVSIDEVNSLIDDFSAKVESARTKFKDAEDLLKQAREIKLTTDPSAERADKIKSLVDQATSLINQAQKDLKDAHELLKKIVKMVKASGVEIKDCKSDELEADEIYDLEDVSEASEQSESTESAESEAETESESTETESQTQEETGEAAQ